MTTAFNGKSAKALPSSQLCELLDQLRLGPNTSSTTERFDEQTGGLGASHTDPSGVQELLPSSACGLQQLELLHGKVVQPVLESLLPRLDRETELSLRSKSKKDKLSLAYLKFLTYAATNNFAGFDLAGVKDATALPMMYEYLQPMMSALLEAKSGLVSKVRTLGYIPSSKPMAETFFRCAIEAGDAQAVASLCSSRHLGINPNEQVCVVDGWRYTPIERSAELQHLALTQCLVHMGVDVNKTCGLFSETHRSCLSQRVKRMYHTQKHQYHNYCQPHGALEYALDTCDKTTSETLTLVSTLLEAGGRVHTCQIARMLEESQTELFKLLVLHCIDQSCSSWVRAGILHQAVHSQDRDVVRFTLEHMQLAKADIDHVYRTLDTLDERSVMRSDQELNEAMDDDKCIWMVPVHPRTFIDIVALRGDVALFQDLLHYAPSITDNTLTAAVRSGNKKLIEQVLDMGASPCGFSPTFHTSPYAEAIRSGDPGLVDLIQSHGGLDKIDEQYQYAAALSAAAEAGNERMLIHLLQRAQRLDRTILGYALAKAAFSNHTDVAITLLEAGASTCDEASLTVFGCLIPSSRSTALEEHPGYRACFPLRSAISNKNAVLVRELLEHDAFRRDLYFFPAIVPAIDWGDIAVLQDLIAANADCREWRDNNASVDAAVRKGDIEVLRLLLKSGFATNQGKGYGYCDPLSTAIEVGDVEILQELLAFGADPLQSSVLMRSSAMPREIFMFLIRWVWRYNANSKLEEVLERAIEDEDLEAVKYLTGNTDGWTECNQLQPCNVPLAFSCQTGAYHTNDSQQSFTPKFDPNTLISDASLNHKPGPYFLRPGKTALLAAIQTRNLELVRLLLDSGADVNYLPLRGVKRTPLQKAAEVGSYAVVQDLLDRGANVNTLPAKRGGSTGLQLAAMGGHIGIFELLLDNGADISAPKSIVDGRYPIEGASEHGRFDMVQYLLDRGAYDTDQLQTALQLAKEHGHSAIAETLEDALARIHVDRTTNAAEDVTASGSTQLHKCNICHNVLSNASAKARHMRTVHGGAASRSNFVCDICSTGFNRKDLLKRHKADKHEDSKVLCQWCGNKYRKDYLKQHEGPCRQRQPEVMELD